MRLLPTLIPIRSGSFSFLMRIGITTLLLTLAAGCQKTAQPFNALDITGTTGYASDFRLIDHTGKPRTMADFRGKAVAIFFGYTQCPDVCPTTLSDMKKAMALLGADAERLQVLFITVDPKRDTQALLSQYIPAFHPSFLGLYGDEAATAKVVADFKVVAQIQPGKTADSYTVAHTAGTLVFDPQGRLRLLIPYGLEAEKIAADVKRLL
ncbi:MAG: SCO family protein [Betaproteobacteria bacterium]|nr:SCO family protein [Betaproteobacteria bacterium]